MTVGVYDLVLFQHDYERALTSALTDGGAAAVIPAGTTVNLHLTAIGTTSPSVGGGACTIIDPDNGLVSYQWASPDLDTPGAFWATFVATFPDGKDRTFPDIGYKTIRVLPAQA